MKEESEEKANSGISQLDFISLSTSLCSRPDASSGRREAARRSDIAMARATAVGHFRISDHVVSGDSGNVREHPSQDFCSPACHW